MKRARKDEKPEDWTPDAEGVARPADKLKNQLEVWSEETECFQVVVDRLRELDSRQNDIWAILFCIASEAEGEWPDRAQASTLALSAGIETEDSLGVWLLTDIRDVFVEKGAVALPSKELLASINDMDESPWGDLKGKPLSSRKLAELLKLFGIKRTTQRMGAERKTAKGYARSAFEDAWARYTPPSNGNRPQERGNDHVNDVTDKASSTLPDPSLLPITRTPSSAYPRDGGPVVTDVTDREEVLDFS